MSTSDLGPSIAVLEELISRFRELKGMSVEDGARRRER